MATYYISPSSGSDSSSGAYTTPLKTFTKAYSLMVAGDTLIIKNGTYTGQTIVSATIRPPSGTSSAYTVVQAETPGSVVIDGAGSNSPFYLNGPPPSPIRYIKFDGLVFRRQGSGAQLYQVDHIKITRCGFEDGGSGNSMTFNLHKFCSYILVEDCYAWGSGRYKFSTYHADHVIFRRCVARQDRHDCNGEPIAVYTIYATDSAEVQNCIAVDGDKGSFWVSPSEYGGCFSVSSTDGPATNNFFRGCIALNTDLAFTVLAKNLTNITFNDCVGWHVREGGWQRDSAAFKNMTLGDFYGPARSTVDSNGVGMRFEWGDDPSNTNSMLNSILTKIKGVALWQFSSENFNAFFANNANRGGGTPTGANSTTVDPTLKYITSNQGSAFSDRGAGITKCIGKSGTLWGEAGYNTIQTDDLWPFPNEDTIKSYMKSYQYQTLSGNRGFCVDTTSLTKYIWEYLGNPNPYNGQPIPQLPAAPAGLVIAFGSNTQIDLTWFDNSNNESSFVIERKINSGNFAQIATTGADIKKYSDINLTPNTLYSYRVKAMNAVGSSDYTNVQSLQTPDTIPNAPTSLIATTISDSQINLSWVDNSNNENTFSVERRIGSDNFLEITQVVSNVVIFNDINLQGDTQYDYRIKAVNSSGISSYSNTAVAKTLPTVIIDPPPVVNANPITRVTIEQQNGEITIFSN